MTQAEAVELITSEKEVIALDKASYAQFLALGLALLNQGIFPIAKISLAANAAIRVGKRA